MTIEIHEPELAALICRRMASGTFIGLDDLLKRALASMQEPLVPDERDAGEKSLLEVAAPLRGLFTDKEIDSMFQRDLSTGRPVDLS